MDTQNKTSKLLELKNTIVNEELENTIQKSNEPQWCPEHEKILVDWADKAMCYRWLHAQANNKFSKLSRFFTIPVIVISTVTGTANFAQDRVPVGFVHYFVMIVGALNIIAGIISTIQQFLKINELNESHRVSSIAWDKFYRNIKIELAKNPKERIPVDQMIKMSKEEFDRLMETSPVLQQDIIGRFTKTFKEHEAFKNIRKPEICDELVSTDLYRFIPKSLDDGINKIKQLKDLKDTYKQFEDNKKKVENFIVSFTKAQSRPPQKEEICEALKEHEELKECTNEELEVIIDEINNDIETNTIDNIISDNNINNNKI
jgi:hypothetical protein